MMASSLLKECLAYLKKSNVFIQFPLNALLYGLEELAEIRFSCPCNVKMNYRFILAMFIGPPFFILALMFLFFRPFKLGYFHCPKKANAETEEKTQQSWPKSFVNCLIPPVMWIIILFLDGDYLVCGYTDWNGHYVFDAELNRSWCKPTKGMQNETELRDLITHHRHYSLYIGHILTGVLGALLVFTVGGFDCCITRKCDRCPNGILIMCGQTDPEQESQMQSSNETENLSAVGRSTNQISMGVPGSDRAHRDKIPGDVPDPETGNRQDVGLTEPTGETQTEPRETETFL
ncbi:uncharacterized protein LOC122331594 [Puntigrus tetrazona]|uniref:uncharacterized protein LOC122331594 n=1 Tax=Puntigrus tetrazona TaxID=1606681 RepID=UPI001C899AB8|nr:uncharacterized protein LOC122331594 [Puntigrus tetrazona]